MKSFQVTEFSAPLAAVEAATPQPSGTQVLIKVKAAGVCHSDLHIWEGGYDLGHGRKPLSLKDRGIPLPLTMGHETVGEVLALGPDAQGEGVAIGEVRLIYPWIGCGTCAVLPRRRREYVPETVFARRVLRRRLCRPHHRSPSALPARSQGARSGHGRSLCLLRRHHLQRAEEGREGFRQSRS